MVKVLVAQSYISLCDPMDYSLPDFFVHNKKDFSLSRSVIYVLA